MWRLVRTPSAPAEGQVSTSVHGTAGGAEQRAAVRLLVLAIALPVGVSFVASALGPRPMWLDRYLIATVPPMLLLVAAAMDGLAGRQVWTTAGLGALACVPAAATTASLVRRDARPRFDLVVSDLARRDSAATITVVAGSTLEEGPLRYAGSGAGLRGRIHLSVSAPADAQASSGWYVWSESHPPPGITPPAALIRSGYDVSMPLEFASARDPVMAVRFQRRPAPHAPPPARRGRSP